jgi:hypothetical protein
VIFFQRYYTHQPAGINGARHVLFINLCGRIMVAALIASIVSISAFIISSMQMLALKDRRNMVRDM